MKTKLTPAQEEEVRYLARMKWAVFTVCANSLSGTPVQNEEQLCELLRTIRCKLPWVSQKFVCDAILCSSKTIEHGIVVLRKAGYSKKSIEDSLRLTLEMCGVDAKALTKDA